MEACLICSKNSKDADTAGMELNEEEGSERGDQKKLWEDVE